MKNESPKLIQIRWHGRGGQGAITAAKVSLKQRLNPAMEALLWPRPLALNDAGHRSQPR